MDLFAIFIGLFIVSFLCVALWRLPLACALVIALTPAYLIRFSLGSIPTTLLEWMIGICVGVWIVRQCRVQEQAHAPIGYPFLLLPKKALFFLVFATIGLVIAATIGMWVSPDVRAALGIWKAYIIEPVLFAFICAHVFKTRRDLTRIIALPLGIACSIAVFALIQKVTGFTIPEPWVSERRVTGVFPYPNALGLYFELFSVGMWILLMRAFSIKQRLKKMFFTAALFFLFVLLVGAVISAQSEGALVAIVAVCLFTSFFWSKEARIKTIYGVIMVTLLIMWMPRLQTYVYEKVTLQDWSSRVRVWQWKETLTMLRAQPLFGAGLAGYKTAIEPYHKREAIEIFLYPHNIFLTLWSELGIVGFLSFFSLLGWIAGCGIVTYRRSMTSDDPLYIRAWGLFFVGSVITIVVHGLVDVPYFKNDLALLFWSLIALQVIVYNSVRKESAGV